MTETSLALPIKTEAEVQQEAFDQHAKEIEIKADEISKKHGGAKVFPFFFSDTTKKDFVDGYLKEPDRFTKLRFLDKSLSGPMFAASELLAAVLIKEESDYRLTSDSPDCDIFFIGACAKARDIISMSVDLYKKK